MASDRDDADPAVRRARVRRPALLDPGRCCPDRANRPGRVSRRSTKRSRAAVIKSRASRSAYDRRIEGAGAGSPHDGAGSRETRLSGDRSSGLGGARRGQPAARQCACREPSGNAGARNPDQRTDFEVAADTVRVALAGAGAESAIGAGNAQRRSGQSVTLPRGEVYRGRGRPPVCLLLSGRRRGYRRAAGSRQRLDLCPRRDRRARGRALRQGDFVPLAMRARV